MLQQFFIFSAVGIVGTAAHFATLALLVETFGLDPLPASLCGFAVGALVNYLLNRRLTFKSHARHSTVLPKFLTVALLGAALNTLLMYLGLHLLQLHYLLAQALAALLVLFWNFTGSRLWAFRTVVKRIDESTQANATDMNTSTHAPASAAADNLLPLTLSVIVPAYNEAEVLSAFHKRLSAMLDGLAPKMAAEIIYVDDGSKDDTRRVLHELAGQSMRVAVIELSRNFGKEMAMTAGLDHAEGDAVVIIDADLQDPPELIPELIRHWREGWDIVNARRTQRNGESALKKFTAHTFYRVMRRMSRQVQIPQDVGDFRLLSRRAVLALRQLREQHRFMKGLFAWIGYPQIEIPYERDARHAGSSKWGYWKLWNFAIEGITSFTNGPLIVATYLGMLTALCAFIYAIAIIWDTLVHGNPVHGYPSLMVVILFLGGVQLMSIGIIGEYLGRMFDEAKGRPLYLVQSWRPSAATQNSGAAKSRGK